MSAATKTIMLLAGFLAANSTALAEDERSDRRDRRIAAGILLGTTVTHDERTGLLAVDDSAASFSLSQMFPSPKRPVYGLDLDFGITESIIVSPSILFRVSGGMQQDLLFVHDTDETFIDRDIHRWRTWEYPILVKYRWSKSRLRPFIGLGPSFRSVDRTDYSSMIGFVSVVGVENRLHKWLSVSPQIRLERWKIKQAGPLNATSPFDLKVMIRLGF